MNKKEEKVKSPISQEKIFKIMLIITFSVAGIFFLKNVIGQNVKGAAVIGVCLLFLVGTIMIMKKFQVEQVKQQFVLAICLVVIVFLISANSGNYYSDDFPLFLAVIGLCGIYLEPHYAKYQTILITILLVVLYLLNPKKADPLSQYIMCIVVFDVAAYTFYLVIKRGRAFIELSFMRAKEAEELIESIKNVGNDLQENYENSSGRIDGMREVNAKLEENASELKKGSGEIFQETHDVETSCAQVQECMQVTEQHIDSLNEEVQKVEKSLSESKITMREMDEQMQSVKKTVDDTKGVFALFQEQIQEISRDTDQLTNIASNTEMLALNASIEAARAGEAGSGFAVVASQVQTLAVDSNRCSEQVIHVVDGMKKQIAKTTDQLEESVLAIDTSLATLQGLQQGFDSLTTQFGSLYKNIEEQNENVSNVDAIFEQLQKKISEMSSHSEENEAVVESIIDAMHTYQEHMNLVVEDTKQIRELSATMLAISAKENDTVQE